MHPLAKVGSTRFNRCLRLKAEARHRRAACPPRPERAVRPLAAGEPSHLHRTHLAGLLGLPVRWRAANHRLSGLVFCQRCLGSLHCQRTMRRQPFFTLALRRSAAPRHQGWLGAGYRLRREALSVVAAQYAAVSGHQRPNHSIERTPSGLRPPVAAHVKRWA